MAVKKQKESSEAPKIKIKYIFQEGYNPIYVNGAYGGMTPSGEIVANFYFERHPLPKSEIISHNCTEFEPQDLTNSAVRIIETGVILSPETARVLAEWLLEQVKRADKLKSET